MDPAKKGRNAALRVPAGMRGANSNLQVVDIGGIAHVWDPVEGVLANLEAISEKIDPETYPANRGVTP